MKRGRPPGNPVVRTARVRHQRAARRVAVLQERRMMIDADLKAARAAARLAARKLQKVLDEQ